MAPRIKHDLDNFRRLVQDGNTKKEIMDEMNIKTESGFTNLKCKLYETDGKVYKIKGGRSVSNTVQMGKNGNKSAAFAETQPHGQDKRQKFNVKITQKRITLNLID